MRQDCEEAIHPGSGARPDGSWENEGTMRNRGSLRLLMGPQILGFVTL